LGDRKLVINEKVLNEDMSMTLFGINHSFSMHKIIEILLTLFSKCYSMLLYSFNTSFCIVHEVVDLKNHDFD
jgi:hypothetical protein